MPSQPACFHRLDEILADLRAMTSTRLDRLAVEKLFRVRIPAAACRGLAVVMRNAGQFRNTGVEVIDPWVGA